MKPVRFAFLVTMLLATGAAAMADDVFPPSWRYDYNTLTVAWDTWGPYGWGPHYPSGFVVQANPGGFGGINDPFPFQAYYDGGVDHVANAYGRTNVLYVNDGSLSFSLENYHNDNPWKDMIVQITFYVGQPSGQYGAPMDFTVGASYADPGNPPWPFGENRDAIVAQSQNHGDGWQTNSYYLSFAPNPDWEGFSIVFTQYPAYVDQVVIDTRCIPEPSTTGLVLAGAIGLLAYAWRRGR
jgi:hypothetical protein